MDNPKQICKNCSFQSDRDYDEMSPFVCRLNPPTRGINDRATWPEVMDSDWCGGFKKKETVNEKDM